MRQETDSTFDVKRFGAVGDGSADDTAAIQQAVDAAAEACGAVWFPPGGYLASRIQMRSHVALTATPTWSYHRNGSAVLRLRDGQERCLVDLTGTIGARISGLALDGGGLGEDVAGISLDGEGHSEEETLVIDNVRVARFSGDAVTLRHVWGYTVRDSMMIFNGGNGLAVTHWDGWVHSNIFNNNHKWGIAFLRPNGACTVTANRIEWNRQGGVCIEHGGSYSINDNFFDRAGGPGLHIRGTEEARPGTITVVGNLFKRSGAKVDPDTLDSCHVRLHYVDGLAMSSNAMVVGANDSGGGLLSPSYGIVCEALRDAVIRDNVMHKGARRELLHDLGGHDDASCIIRDNPGRLAPDPEAPQAG